MKPKQTNQTNKIDDIKRLSLELKTLSKSIINQKITQDEIDQIAEAVSTNLQQELTIEDTLKLICEEIKSHITTEINSLQNNMVLYFEDQKNKLSKLI